jgi:ABC-type multidrug transport system ATPase subunit
LEVLSIVLVEQNAALVFDVADDTVILNSGQVVAEGPAADLKRDGIDLRRHRGVYRLALFANDSAVFRRILPDLRLWKNDADLHSSLRHRLSRPEAGRA